jgi:hypothetical protein
MYGVRRFSSGIGCALALLVPLSARANASAFELAWRAPAACPPREEVLARATRLLGHEPGATLERPLTVDAVVEQSSDDTWRLQVTLGEQSPARSVAASSCDELGDAAALLIALSIDPTLDPSATAPAAAPTAPEPAAAPEPTTAPPPEPAAAATKPAPIAEPSRAEGAPWQLRLGAALALWAGRLPGVAPGGQAYVSLGRERASLSLDLGFFPPQHAGIAGSEAGGELWLASAGPKLGYAFPVGAASITPRLGAELQFVRGAGSGVENPSSAQAVLVGVEAGTRVGVQLAQGWQGFAEGAVSALIWRPRFVLDGVGQVHQPERLGLRFGLGAEWRAF